MKLFLSIFDGILVGTNIWFWLISNQASSTPIAFLGGMSCGILIWSWVSVITGDESDKSADTNSD